MKRIVDWLIGAGRRERGQMLIVFALIVVPVTFAIGVVAVDASMWQSERRGAQKDADLAALAGAYELIDPAASASDASDAANAYADANDEAGNGSDDQTNVRAVTVDDSCWDDSGRLDSVTVDLDHDSRTFFATAFGMDVAPSIGAHARACVGSIISGTGRIPIQIDNNGPCFTQPQEVPIYTQLCALEFGAFDNNPRGVIDLVDSGDWCSKAGGSGDLYDLILNGAGGYCTIDNDTPPGCDPNRNGPWTDCVAVQAGNARKIVNGFGDRIKREGSCDNDGSGVEEFSETVDLIVDSGDPATSLYEARECPDGHISWRIVTIFVLDSNPPINSGNQGHDIQAFASFYIKGCIFEDRTVAVDPANIDPECAPRNNFGHVVIYGNFVRLLTEGDAGAFDPSATNLGITLVE